MFGLVVISLFIVLRRSWVQFSMCTVFFLYYLYNQCKIINLLNGVHRSSLESTGVQWSPVESNPLHQCIPVTKVHMDSTWTVQSTPVMTDISRLGCGESPLESSGVHMEYGGDRQELIFLTLYYKYII